MHPGQAEGGILTYSAVGRDLIEVWVLGQGSDYQEGGEGGQLDAHR